MKIRLKTLIDEDFTNYKMASMLIGCHSCTFKCERECGEKFCQNSSLATAPTIEVEIEDLIKRYLDNPITNAIVFGGLEPFDDRDCVLRFISSLRTTHNNNDDVVIYTGYTEEEVKHAFYNYYNLLKNYGNVIIKYGRFVPNNDKHFDEVLGVYLSSDNQYAKRIG